ncbi:RNA exonuclease 4 isoform X1 [Morus notabilis]|uniref:RNA exonuclease 4 isoform X1 n=2 Tax=Morus notabilis TaxID=981085 RepID=UPI000CED1E6D|nr:RNA exonuclease 4 isoform X1 [Morus notabilis]
MPSTRHKCSACYKQYKKQEHLVEHMLLSFHSVHQPRCGVCGKHCKSFESLREHITGPLAKANCSTVFSERGCNLCLRLLDSITSLNEHKELCCFSAPAPLGTIKLPYAVSQIDVSDSNGENLIERGPEAIAMDCEMVGGGSDGSLDLCARVCLIDENEKLLFHAYVEPPISVTNYRYEVTGLTEEHLRNAMPLKEVQEKILQILYNGESIGRIRVLSDGGKARLLVGHNIEHDLDCLRMNYPNHLLRDTAKYHPLMKTNLVSHSLKYLTRTYLGYDIQTGFHDPYEDCVSVMRLYKRMRDLEHHKESIEGSFATHGSQNHFNNFTSWNTKELEKMTPDELYQLSRSNYRCWCLDQGQNTDNN